MRNTMLVIITFLLTILFFYAATVKALDYNRFIDSMGQSPLLVPFSKPVLAPVILGVEYLAALLINIPATRKAGMYVSFLVMLTFSLYLGVLYFFFDNIPCSCGGILGNMSYPVHIGFNVFFTLLSFYGVVLSSKNRKPQKLRVVV
jgi:hypothetical protein